MNQPKIEHFVPVPSSTERLSSLSNILQSAQQKTPHTNLVLAQGLVDAALLIGQVNYELMDSIVSTIKLVEAETDQLEEILQALDLAWDIQLDMPIPYCVGDDRAVSDTVPPPSTIGNAQALQFTQNDDFRVIEPEYIGDGFTEEYLHTGGGVS